MQNTDRSKLDKLAPPIARIMLDLAKEIQPQAEVSQSKYKVGAVVLDEHGNIHRGVNVENVAHTETHAERSAISAGFAATPRGSKIMAVAVYTENGGSPCGDCRQHIWQFCGNNPNVPIYCEDKNGDIEIFRIGELLPYPFKF